MKIKTQILIWILTTTIIIFSGAVGYIALRTKEIARDDAKKITDSFALLNANMIKAELSMHLGLVRSMAHSFISYEDVDADARRKLYDEMLNNIFIENSGYLAVWAIWEKSYFEADYNETFGSEMSVVHEFSGKIILEHEELYLDGDDQASIYYTVKMSVEEAISSPEFISYDPRVVEEYVAKICVPIVEDGNFIGCAGVDIKLSALQDIVKNIQQKNNASALLLSNGGTYIYHQKNSNISREIAQVQPHYNENYDISNKIKNGEIFSTFEEELNQYTAYAPVNIGNTKTPWSIGISVDIDDIMQDANNSFMVTIVIGIVGIVMLIIVILIVSQRISYSLINTTKILTNLSSGDISEQNKIRIQSDKSEIGQINKSVNKLIDGLNRTANFAEKIGEGKLDAQYSLLSEQDILGNSLLEMRKNLIHARDEDERRKKEDDKRNWATQGLAELGEIVRQSRGDYEEFSQNIIKSLTKYLNANQAGLFIINDDNRDDIFIELVAAYAYNREKMMTSRINMGVGLIGRCILEKKTIFMSEIPEQYVTITSGLGESPPTNILIVPLIFDDIVYGVIELASFNVFELHEVEFVEKFGESVAATVSNLKINLRTARLLEESNKKSRELAIQEKEMRQNVTELQIAQEESHRKEIELTGVLNAIASVSTIIQYNVDGKIVNIDGPNLHGGSYYKHSMIGRYHHDYDRKSVEAPYEYHQFWDDLLKGRSRDRIIFAEQNDIKQWLSERYTPVKDDSGRVYKIINIGTDITESKTLENRLVEQRNELLSSEEELRQNLEELQTTQEEIVMRNIQIESLVNAVDRALMRAEFSSDGFIDVANEKYANTLDYDVQEIIGQHYALFVPEDDKKMLSKIWKSLVQGKSFQGQMKVISKKGTEKWFLLSYTPQLGELDSIVKIYLLAYDITESKKLELEVVNQTEELARQEEGLRQTLEMFQITQEEMALQAAQNASLIEAINSSSVVVETDPFGIILKANDEFIRLVNLPEDKIVGHRYSNFIDLSDKDITHIDNFWEGLRQGAIKKKTTRLNKEDDIWLHETYSPIFDEHRNVVKILNIASDITSRKIQEEVLKEQTDNLMATEEELRQNLEELQATQEEIMKKTLEMEALNVAVDKALMRAAFSIEGVFIDINDGFANHLGYKIHELLSRPIFDLLSDDYLVEFPAIWEKLKTEDAYQGEISIKTKQKNEKWFLITLVPEINEDEIIKIFLLGYDITESKNLELEVRKQADELREQEEGLRQTLEEFEATQEEMMRESFVNNGRFNAFKSTILIAEIEANGKILTINDRFLDFLKLSQADFINKHFDEAAFACYDKFSDILNIINQEVCYKATLSFMVDNEARHILQHIYPIYDNNQNIYCYLDLALDITEKINNEIEIDKLKQELESKYAEILELKGLVK